MHLIRLKGLRRAKSILAATGLILSLICAAVFVFGKSQENDKNTRAINDFSCTADTWTSVTTINAPAARGDHTAIWTGSEMIIWGGYAYQYFNTGGRYNPSLNSWTPISTVNAPSGRNQHTAVWTGTNMIIWGGFNTSYPTTGAKYNPSTDTWTTIASSCAGRTQHSAIWTGTEMIIWGGYNGSYLNTGCRFNPGTGTWAPISAVNVPSPRGRHTAVWTGTEMIIWGGYNGSSYPNTGARYNPSTDTWTSATSTTNAPTGRSYHTAVWSGMHMIIWGGTNSITYYDTGSRYNPTTNTWTATSTIGAPVGRREHTAVWSGTTMIVWGGYDSSFLNTGGRYNPTTDFWTSTNPTGVPGVRNKHTAVATDTEMIIWGGYDTSYLGTGGRYCLDTCGTPTFEGVQSVSDLNNCDRGIEIRWLPPSDWGHGATSGTYDVRRFTDSACTGAYSTVKSSLPAATTSYIDTSTTASITYYYQIRATNNCAVPLSSTGTLSCSASIIDQSSSPPSGLTNNTAIDLDACADTGVSITWTADPAQWNDNGGTRTYDVLRGSTPANAAPIPYGTTAYIDTAGVNGSIYAYTIRYNNGCNKSAATIPGAQAADNIGADPIGLTNNTAIDPDACAFSGIRITWNCNPSNWGDSANGTRTYEVLRNGTPISGILSYCSSGTTSYVDTTGTQTTTYTYAVTYYNGCSLSATTSGAQAADNATPCSLESQEPEMDDSGSPTHNGIIEMNENVKMIGSIKNTGTSTATAVVATLITSDPIIIDTATASYPNIPPGETQNCLSCYWLHAPSAYRPALHWDFSIYELPCTGCPSASFGPFTYHVGNSFSDVLPSNSFYSYIETMLHDNVTTGCNATQYCPNSYVQRDAMAKFICNAMNAETPNSCVTQTCQGNFTDVTTSNPFCIYIEALANALIVSGCQASPPKYCPSDLVIRESMAKFICNAMNVSHPGSCANAPCAGIFQDVPTTNPFCTYIEGLYNAAVVAGCSTTPLLYCPQLLVTRAQMSKFIVNGFGLTL